MLCLADNDLNCLRVLCGPIIMQRNQFSSKFLTGLAVSLLCGPFFAVCFAGTSVATLGGATVGAAMAGSTVLSTEDAERVIHYLEDLQQSRNLSDELAAAVTVRLPATRLSVPRTADAHLGLEAQGLSVLPGFEDTIALWIIEPLYRRTRFGGYYRPTKD